MIKPDVIYYNDGSVILIRPVSKAGKDWMSENVEYEPWQMFAGALAVEPRMADDLLFGMQGDGLTIAQE